MRPPFPTYRQTYPPKDTSFSHLAARTNIKISSFQRDNHGQKLFVMNVNPTILRRVISTKRVSQRLQRDAQLDKVVECDGAAMPSIVLLDEEIDGGRLQTISHHPQRGR